MPLWAPQWAERSPAGSHLAPCPLLRQHTLQTFLGFQSNLSELFRVNQRPRLRVELTAGRSQAGRRHVALCPGAVLRKLSSYPSGGTAPSDKVRAWGPPYLC